MALGLTCPFFPPRMRVKKRTWIRMVAITRVERLDRESRLSELGLTRDLLLEVVEACVAADGDCTSNDPPMARGLKVFFAGVRRLRELLGPLEWEKDDTGGYSTVVHHGRRIKLAFMNTDNSTCNAIAALPVNRSRKGPNSQRVASINQGLLPGIEWPTIRADGTRPPADDYLTWHMCVYIERDRVRSELALLSGFEGGFYTDCHERIFLINEGDWDGVGGPRPDDDLGPEIEVEVRRK
jgi:hypothetical protein